MIFMLVLIVVFLSSLYGGYKWGSHTAINAAVEVMEERGLFR